MVVIWITTVHEFLLIKPLAQLHLVKRNFNSWLMSGPWNHRISFSFVELPIFLALITIKINVL